MNNPWQDRKQLLFLYVKQFVEERRFDFCDSLHGFVITPPVHV